MNTDQSDIDVDALMRQIRADIAAREHAGAGHAYAANAHGSGPVELDRVALGRFPISAGIIAHQERYRLADFFVYHDEDFVANAYRGLLRREPDATGATQYLARLRSGELAKVEILGRIRYSKEGRAAAVPVRGLAPAFALRTARRVPVLGPVLGIAQYVVRLPTLVRNLERLENAVFWHRREVRQGVNGLESEIEAAFARSAANVGELTRTTSARTDQLAAELRQGLQESAERAAAWRRELERAHNDAIAGLRQDVERVDAEATARLDRTAEAWRAELADSAARLHRVADDLEAGLAAIAESKAERTGLEALVAEVRAAHQESKMEATRLASELSAVDGRLLDYRRSLLEQERRLGILLSPASEAAPERRHARPEDAERAHLLDAFYTSFEFAFRGTEDDIRGRVAVYLPYMQAASSATAGALVLDVGCGRGEWLELLRANGHPARGVDSNRSMVGHCRARGLDVVESDAIGYLRELEPGSLGAVTGFHVIEHLPFASLVDLLDEVRRVLKPGGVAIFETPNPENLIVGACNFWYDPTHVRPLPPEPMRFVLQARGFGRVEILRLHPRSDAPQAAAGNALEAALVERLYGPQDYALIAHMS